MIAVRRAGQLDTREMANILNTIIATGGTTAFENPIARGDIASWMARDADRSIWHIAETEDGRIMGFQWVAPHDEIGEGACSIATFTRQGSTGLGIGTALFEATKAAVRAQGYTWINARIRTYNVGGLAYYQSRGFEDWKTTPEAVFKRYDL